MFAERDVEANEREYREGDREREAEKTENKENEKREAGQRVSTLGTVRRGRLPQ